MAAWLASILLKPSRVNRGPCLLMMALWSGSVLAAEDGTPADAPSLTPAAEVAQTSADVEHARLIPQSPGERVLWGLGSGLIGGVGGAGLGALLGCVGGSVIMVSQVSRGCLIGALFMFFPGAIVGMPVGITFFGGREQAVHPGIAYWGAFLGAAAGAGLGGLGIALTGAEALARWIPPLALAGATLGWALPARGAAVAVTPSLVLDGQSTQVGITGRF